MILAISTFSGLFFMVSWGAGLIIYVWIYTVLVEEGYDLGWNSYHLWSQFKDLIKNEPDPKRKRRYLIIQAALISLIPIQFFALLLLMHK